MTSKWELAQTLEPGHWLANKEAILSNAYRDNIRERSRILQSELSGFISLDNPELNLLELGGGATQLVEFFPKCCKYMIEPLADLYLKEFGDVIDEKEVTWIKGKAEKIEFPDDYFDIVIARNVLDHVDNISAVLSDIKRVLKPGGIAYLGTNVFSGLLYLTRKIVKDKEHPYIFTHRSMQTLIDTADFQVLKVVRDDPPQMKHFNELESTALFSRLARTAFLKMNCYHFSEFYVAKA